MREALARIDNDFVLSEPRRKGKQRDDAPGFFRTVARAIHYAACHANLLLGLVFAALLGAVVMNALVWQKTRHPAPLFGHSIQIEAKVEAAHDAPVPVPTSRPAIMPEPATAAEQPASLPHGRDPMAEVAELQSQKSAAPRDPIAQLLKSPAPAPTPVPAESSKTVLAAQRALMKLGYVVKPDGVMRPATRQALEQFERDHKLPAHGTLSPKVLHELSAESGITVE